MHIKYFADIRSLTKRDEQPWSQAEPDLRSLLQELSAQHGAAFRNKMFDGDELSRTIIILVNGQNVLHTGGLDTALGEQDVVAIFPMVAGG